MLIILGNDPNEAYEITPSDRPAGWFRIRCNGIPVWLCPSPEAAERYVSDPDYRLSLMAVKYHDK